MLLDDVYAEIGDIGRYQILLCCCLFLLLGWPSPAVTIVYTAIDLDHWCELPSSNSSLQDQKARWLPWNNKTGTYDQCHRYIDASDGNLSDVVKCDGWMYDTSEFGRTIVSIYDIVCDRHWLLSIVRTSFLLGIVFGAVGSGFISDKFGRRRTLFGASILVSLSWLMGILAPNITVYIVSRFFVGTFRLTVYMSGILLCMELVGPKWRFLMGMLVNTSYALGYMMLAGFAYAIKDSVYFELTALCPYFFFLLFYFLLPESPRWLLATGKEEEARRVLADIGQKNGHPLPETVTELYLDAFWDAWLTAFLLYYLLTLNSQSLVPGNFYLNNFLMAFLEVPATLIGVGLSSWKVTGRRYTAFLSTTGVGICGFISVVMTVYGFEVAVTVFALTSKLLIGMSFNMMYVYTPELLPTEVRHVGFGAATSLGRMFALLSAYLGEALSSLWQPLPYVVFGVMGTIAGGLDLLLPETLNQNLSDTIEEEEEKCRKKTTVDSVSSAQLLKGKPTKA